MKNLFNSIQLTKPKNNVFDLSHDVKLSLDIGTLTPTCCIPVVPGDKFSIGCENMIRVAPMVAPVMHRLDVMNHYFFVPYRLLWSNWEKYITNGGDQPIAEPPAPLPAFPYVKLSAALGGYSDLADYLGLPRPDQSTGSETERVSAMPFAAYQFIYNEYYRDQNLIPSVAFELADGDNGNIGAVPIGTMRKRAWEHDYFTAALPFAQKGTPVEIPIGLGDAPLKFASDGSPIPGGVQIETILAGSPVAGGVGVPDTLPPDGIASGRYYADNSDTAIAGTINDLRVAYKVQEWLEKAARGGTRYIESILMHFGVRSSDKRLQRPEYITGTKAPVIISEVLNTTGTEDAPQGNMSGHGISVTNGRYGSYYAEEHGLIIGIMSVMPKTAYQQGIDRHWLNINSPTEQYFPSFAHLGEQAVSKREVYAYTTNGDDVFGYVPRYAEYKFVNSRVAGEFRSTLNFWHLGRIFDAEPGLNQEFVECTPRLDFLAAGGSSNYIWAHVLHKIRAVRPMPKFGSPSGL